MNSNWSQVGQDHRPSFGTEAAPLGESGGEFLQTSHLPEAQHRPLPSSERQVRILNTVIPPAPRFLAMNGADFAQRSTLGPEFVGHDYLGMAMFAHCFS